MNPYPASYHAACQWLVANSASSPSKYGRAIIAKALRDLRRVRGAADAAFNRRHLLYIGGCFPAK